MWEVMLARRSPNEMICGVAQPRSTMALWPVAVLPCYLWAARAALLW
jgi:hypothetical protein